MRYYEILNEQRVLSSWINDLNYDDGKIIMTLNNGRKYMIKDTPEELYNKWIISPSKGKFWHANIARKYKVSQTF